ncbi:MAG: putative metal-dependent hydrolase [Planctomycetota bacterium]|nr:putative metal-dependent hydrolase [Planctomycetota bacterium]
MSTDPRFPIGPFEAPATYSSDTIRAGIERIAACPANLRAAVAGLDEAQLDTPYREGGWTVRQVVHHLPDSHMNSLVRIKLALTEDEPTIRPYDEAAWGELIGAREGAVEPSLTLLEALHAVWVPLLEGLDSDELGRRFHHPEMQAPLDLATQVSLYAWHGDHHVAHVTRLREARGW